jgi:hypothetical protein
VITAVSGRTGPEQRIGAGCSLAHSAYSTVRSLVGAYEPTAARRALAYGVDVLTRTLELYAELGGGGITLTFTD